MESKFRFDPVDVKQMQLIANLSPSKRLWLMLRAQRMTRTAIRTRLKRMYPHAEKSEMGQLMLKEIERVNQLSGRF